MPGFRQSTLLEAVSRHHVACTYNTSVLKIRSSSFSIRSSCLESRVACPGAGGATAAGRQRAAVRLGWHGCEAIPQQVRLCGLGCGKGLTCTCGVAAAF